MINDDCTAGCFWSAAPKETHSDIKRGGVEEEEEEEEELSLIHISEPTRR